MSQLTILRPGMMMTVQDRGRAGMLRFGVSGAGPMDPEAAQMANALIGNDPGAAVLEFAHFGGALRLDADRTIAVCGAVADLRIGGRAVAPWAAHPVRAGEEIVIGAMRDTVWGYVAIGGGIDTPPVLGARSTHLRSGIGGQEGRSLREGDVLPLGAAAAQTAAETAVRRLLRPWRPRLGPIRVVLGPQQDHFSDEVVATFLGRPFTVTQKRDRMAMVLEGPALPAARGHDIVSDGTLHGSVQVPGSGQPMILLADRQTTGGYPKIATVIGPDLPRLAQLAAGRQLRFHAISQSRAEEASIAQAAAFATALAEVTGGTP